MTTTSEVPKKRHGNQQLDEASAVMLYQGVTLAQASRLFGIEASSLRAKITGRVVPCGQRAQNPVYQIKDLAPYLVKPPYDMDEFIQRMTIADLPPILRKEFWAGLRSRQLYEKEAAELWPTAKVVEIVSQLLKTIRMAWLLTRETVERETELTARQREIITRIIDNALEDAHDKCLAQFSQTKADTNSAARIFVSSPDTEDL